MAGWRESKGSAPSHSARPAQKWDLRRGFTASLIAHVFLLIAVTVLARTRFTPPERTDVIPVDLISMPAPAPAPIERTRAEAPSPRVEEPDPLEPAEKKPPPKPKEKPKPPRETPTKPRNDAKDQELKTGRADTTRTRPSDLPALGDDTGPLQLQVDGPALEYSYYLRLIRDKIASYWEPPSEAAPSKGKVSAVVRFRIERDGRVMQLILEEPSGSIVFDQAAQRAIDRASPLPPLPPEYPQEWLGIHLRFVFTD